MEYYGNNDWRDYLALKHHGIMGMKWGKRNGPPYPLGYGDHSSAEKKANPKGRLDNYEPAGRIKKKKVTESNSSSQTVSKAQAFVGGAAGGAISEAADLAKRAKRDGVSMNEAAIRKLQEKVDNGTASSYEKWMLKRQRQAQEKKAQKQLEEKQTPIKEKKLSRRQQRQKDKDDYEMAIRNDNGDIDYKKFLDNSNFDFIMLDRETEQRIKDSIDRLNEEHRRDGTNEKYRKMKADRR